MKRLLFKIGIAFLLGFTGILLLMALMSQLGTTLRIAYAAGPRYVAPGGSDSGNVCATLASPCATIQHAVDVADSGDVIKVAAGVYTEVNHYGGLSQTVYLSKSVYIQGGYTLAFSDPPDPAANPTTLDAQGQGRVIYITGTVAPTIEGLRITNGNAANLVGAPWGGDAGGGVYVITAAPVFSRNQIVENTAEDGGGMFLYDSRATLFGNTIMSNTANAGGGFTLFNSNQIIDGRIVWDSPATVTHNIIMSNTATSPGGGGVIFYSDAVLTGNIIASNQANQGGGLHIGSSYPVFQNNQIFNNEAVEGGGLQAIGCKIYFTNDILVDNFSQEKGSGLYLQGSQAHGLHLTIASNNGGDGSGLHLIQSSGGSPSQAILTNTIIASHTLGITLTTGSTASLESTLWYGNGANWAGGGIVTASNSYTGNPAFLDPAGGDYHLGSTSAAINKGVAAGVTFDIDGETRDGIPDLGADEFLGLSEILIEGGQRWFPGATLSFPLDNHLANTPYQIWLDRNGPQTTLLGTLISDAQGKGSLTYTLPATLPFKSNPGYFVQSYRQLSNIPEASTELELILPLALHKTAPATATPGLQLTYTLRVINVMPFSLTHLVLTDTLPAGASYITGGTKVGQVVSWTLSSLAPGATVTKTFVVTATHSLTNHNYAVRTGEGAQLKGTTQVVTLIKDNVVNEKRLYLPLLVKN